MNPSQTVGTRRDPLGFSAWRNIAHRIFLRVESPFIRHWFKNRLPPSPTSQVGSHLWMLGNGGEIRKGKIQNSWQEVCYQLCAEALEDESQVTMDFIGSETAWILGWCSVSGLEAIFTSIDIEAALASSFSQRAGYLPKLHPVRLPAWWFAAAPPERASPAAASAGDIHPQY